VDVKMFYFTCNRGLTEWLFV